MRILAEFDLERSIEGFGELIDFIKIINGIVGLFLQELIVHQREDDFTKVTRTPDVPMVQHGRGQSSEFLKGKVSQAPAKMLS